MSQLRLSLLLVALAVAASLPSLRNGFVYDDVPVVRDDVRIRTLHPDLLRLPYWDDAARDRLYRPITTASFALDYATGGGSPFTFHLTNVLLNALVVLLIFALSLQVLTSLPAAFSASALFAVHPVHVEAVANIVGRAELLAAAGYLIAVLSWMSRRPLAPLGVLGGALLAFGGKEHALTLPAALILADAWRARWNGPALLREFRSHAITWVAVVVMGAGYLALRSSVIGTVVGGGVVGAGLENLGAGERAMVMSPAILVWARLLVLPVALSADYSPDHYVPSVQLSARHVLGWLLLLAAAVGAWRLRHRAPGVTFGILWIIIAGSIAANVVVPTGIVLAERTLYLASAGFVIAAGALWLMIPPGRWLWPATALVLGLLGARTITRAGVWRDTDHFYEALIRDAPDSYRAHWARGSRAFAQRRMAEGEREYLAAIRTYPNDGAVMQELGERYVAAGAWTPADRWLTLAWRVDSLRFDAGLLAVVVRLRMGRADSAAALADAVMRRFPDAPTIHLAAADAADSLGAPLRALSLRRRAVFSGPSVWQLQYAAARGAARAGRCQEALWRVQRAIALDPDDPAPRALLARLQEGECRPA